MGADPETDLSLLKIEAENLPTIVIGSSAKLRVGDIVLAIGNPFGVGQTVTQGIISATGRNQLGLNTFEDFIQTDAAINPGSSGGALINADGQLVGINTAIFTRTGGSQGIGFAIPVNLARDVMQQLVEHGHVVRGWLGVEGTNVSPELVKTYQLKNNHGVVISNVFPQGPAAKAGLKANDILLEIGEVAINDVRSALHLIARSRPGDKLVVRGIRDAREFEIVAEVSVRPIEPENTNTEASE
jgi:serine protease DegS